MCGDFDDYDESVELRAQVLEAKQRNTTLSILLCEACGIAFGDTPSFAASLELYNWWETHKAEDERRRKVANELLALSPEALQELKDKGYKP